MATKKSAVDLDAILTAGGAPRVALMRHCVKSVTMEPLFVFFVREYSLRPTHAGALALYDVFCSPTALARLKAWRALPPRNLRVASAIAKIRQEFDAQQSADASTASTIRATTPHRNLFDDIVAAVRKERRGPWTTLARRYDPELSPEANLPGGKMTPGQRQFVDTTWRPHARPRLMSAGFWQISTID